MSDNVLAQQIAENNRKLQLDLDHANESIDKKNNELAQYAALGTVAEISEKLNSADAVLGADTSISEAYQNLTESFGSEEEITENLSRLNLFEAEHGSLSDVTEALEVSKTTLSGLSTFIEKHGTLDRVEESLIRVAARMPEFESAISEAKAAREFQESRGTFAEISEALDIAGQHLSSIVESKTADKMTQVAESYGKTTEQLQLVLEGFGLTLDQIDERANLLGWTKVEVGSVNESLGNINEATYCDEDGNEITDESLKGLGLMDQDGNMTVSVDEMKEKGYVNESNTLNVQAMVSEGVVSLQTAIDMGYSITESKAPGRAFHKMLTGRNYTNVEPIAESNVSRQIDEGKNPEQGSRFARMVGAKK